MPYHFNTDGIDEDMFLLQMLICGSENYCSEYALKMDCEEEEFGWQHYFFHLKGAVSKIVIETSVKSRMLADYIDKNEDYLNVKSDDLLNKAIGSHSLGYVLNGNVNLNLRESFNKIIHATEMTLAYDTQDGDKGEYQRWTGVIELEGTYGKNDWTVGIELFKWSRAVQNFILLLDNNIEWPNIYQNDY